MASTSSPLSINGNGSQLLSLSSRTHLPPATFLRFGFRSDQDGISTNGRIRGQALRILASANVSGKGGGRREIIMVDPLEAKQLAAQQMKVIRAKEKFKRRRQIEAINGAWAMIGLTAGLVIEGRTGKSILDQGRKTVFNFMEFKTMDRIQPLRTTINEAFISAF